MSVTVVTPPASEPVILEEAKTWLKIDGTDSDAQIAALITASVEMAENFTRRAFINRTLKLTLDLPCNRDIWIPGHFDAPVNYFDGALPTVIELPHPPVSSITSVVTYGLDNDDTTMSASNYRLSGNRLVLADTVYWPTMRAIGAAEITYVAGYGATSSSVPMPIKTAILIQTAKMYDSVGMCSEVTSAAAQLLNQYKIYG